MKAHNVTINNLVSLPFSNNNKDLLNKGTQQLTQQLLIYDFKNKSFSFAPKKKLQNVCPFLAEFYK